ncbi:hypothetical protein XNC1_0700 [Xenorhabdus nematophila ATCC 19061]|uniref:Transposase n=1 Tax=Xenorhabdus nematophila (strain ATCC 19061 / DSM 3370 / CCUG 14189 / LMG 1036 / NCIMB 9965 / AN6) TaxID=406817 RepID=D3VJL5_XENNA
MLPFSPVTLSMNVFFQRDIILWAVRWYCKYGISYRELQEMLGFCRINRENLSQCGVGCILCS